jgi:hypothetical protein
VPTLLMLAVYSVGSKRHVGGRTTGTSPSSSVSSATTLPRRWCTAPLVRGSSARSPHVSPTHLGFPCTLLQLGPYCVPLGLLGKVMLSGKSCSAARCVGTPALALASL